MQNGQNKLLPRIEEHGNEKAFIPNINVPLELIKQQDLLLSYTLI